MSIPFLVCEPYSKHPGVIDLDTRHLVSVSISTPKTPVFRLFSDIAYYALSRYAIMVYAVFAAAGSVLLKRLLPLPVGCGLNGARGPRKKVSG